MGAASWSVKDWVALLTAVAACFSAVAIAAWRVSKVIHQWEEHRDHIEAELSRYRGDVNLAVHKLEDALERLRDDVRDIEALSHELSSQKAVLVAEVNAIRRELERELVDKNGALSVRFLEMEKRLSAIERSMR